MLETNGIPPKLNNQVCEACFCQQYWSQGKLVQEVDVLLLKVNGHWQQLYFDTGIVFWRTLQEPPQQAVAPADAPFTYPWIDLGEQHGLNDAVISDTLTEALVEGARVTLVFEGVGSLIISHSDNQTRLKFNPV